MIDTRLDAAEERFRTWLANLPPDGWESTSHELGDELHAFAERHRLYAFVPLCPGRKMAELTGFLSIHGFALTHHRSKHARTLRFTRSTVGGEPWAAGYPPGVRNTPR